MVNKKERTLVVIKPDGVQRSLIGEIIRRYERSGLKLVGIKMLVPSEEFIEKHYLIDPEWKMKNGVKVIQAAKDKGIKSRMEDPIDQGEFVLGVLKKFLSAGPVIAMALQGMHAVALARKITGGTEPLTSDAGTIRGDFTTDSYEISDADERAVRNLVHASGSVEDAEKEIKHWFKDEELINYRLVQEEILYDVNLDGLLE